MLPIGSHVFGAFPPQHDADSTAIAPPDLSDALTRLQANDASLTQLVLDNMVLDIPGLGALADALKYNSCLTALDLSRNQFGELGGWALAELLTSNHGLTHLNLLGNKLGGSSPPLFGRSTDALLEALAANTHLLNLSLQFNVLDDDNALTLAVALTRNTHLSELDLTANHIHETGVLALAEALKRNTRLTELQLGYNRIGNTGMAALARLLAQYHHLTRLDLAVTSFTEPGALALAEALAYNTSLCELKLSGNRPGEQGVRAWAEALKRNTCLTTLDLSNNLLRNEGAEVMAQALALNSGLRQLNLNHNCIDDQGGQALAAALKLNGKLVALNLEENWIPETTLSAIEILLARNCQVAAECAQALFQQGQRLAAARHFHGAAGAFRQALDLGQHLYCSAAIQQPIQTALTSARQALAQADELVRRGQAHLQAQRYPQALASFEQALGGCGDHSAGLRGRCDVRAAMRVNVAMDEPGPAGTKQQVGIKRKSGDEVD